MGKKFGMSGRNLELLTEILNTPEEIQQSVARGLITQDAARRIARLPLEQQQELAHDVGEWLEGAKTSDGLAYRVDRLVKSFLPKADRAGKGPKRPAKKRATVKQYLAAMERNAATLQHIFVEKPALWSRHGPRLKRVHERQAQLIEKMESTNGE